VPNIKNQLPVSLVSLLYSIICFCRSSWKHMPRILSNEQSEYTTQLSQTN